MSKVLVTPADLPAAGLCVTGGRHWFAANGLDFRDFIKNGTPVEVIRATGCPKGEMACRAAEARVAQELANEEQSDGR